MTNEEFAALADRGYELEIAIRLTEQGRTNFTPQEIAEMRAELIEISARVNAELIALAAGTRAQERAGMVH